jgi:uncharacterized protein (DUF2267 family)
VEGSPGVKGVFAMKIEEFLEAVREGLEAESIEDADRIVRVVVGALKSALPAETETAIGRLLPGELEAGWKQVEPLPLDHIEQEDMYLEEGPAGRKSSESPSITAG